VPGAAARSTTPRPDGATSGSPGGSRNFSCAVLPLPAVCGGENEGALGANQLPLWPAVAPARGIASAVRRTAVEETSRPSSRDPREVV
jgi:hypothetical protein